jgi:hypothetical protein
MDFFTVPTLTFGVLYCVFVIAHNSRRILHFNVTKHPTSAWVIQQLREAFPYNSDPSYLIFDRCLKLDSKAVLQNGKLAPEVCPLACYDKHLSLFTVELPCPCAADTSVQLSSNGSHSRIYG